MNLDRWRQRLPNRSMLLKVVNYLFFNFLWPACIFGAAAQVWWPGALLLAGFFLWHWLSGSTVRGDWKLVLIMVPLGIAVDTLWIRLELLSFATPWPSVHYAPMWIVILWAGLALALNHCLLWMQSRLWLTAVLFLLASPFSYWCGSRFEAVTWLAPDWQVIAATGISWAVLMPLLLWLAARLRGDAVPPERAAQQSV
jgi:hypothetical protein